MGRIEGIVYGMSEEEYNILRWAGAEFVPVYDKGSKACGDRRRRFSHLHYPEGTRIIEDAGWQMREGLDVRRPQLVVLPGGYPVIRILWGSVPEEGIEEFPFYEVAADHSSQASLDWYYYSQAGIPYRICSGDGDGTGGYFECTCCHQRTPFGAVRSSRGHRHHPGCIHLKKKAA